MKRLGKWLLVSVWVYSFICGGSPTYAQGIETITVTVAVSGTIGVSVSPDSINLGTLNFGEVGMVSQGSITVLAENEGVLQKYSLHVHSIQPSDWNCGTSTAAVNQFVLCGLFNSSQPNIGSFTESVDPDTGDAIVEYASGLPPPYNEPRQASAQPNEVFTGDEVGQNIQPNEERHLWFRFRPPTTGVGSGVQHSITVIITAEPQG